MAQVESRIAAIKKIVKGHTTTGKDEEDDEEIDWVGLEELLGDFNTKAVAVAVSVEGKKKKSGKKGGGKGGATREDKGGMKSEMEDGKNGETGAIDEIPEAEGEEEVEGTKGLPPRPQSASSHLSQGDKALPQSHHHRKKAQPPKVRGVEFLPDGRPLKRFPLSVSPPRPSFPGRAAGKGEGNVVMVKPKAKPFGLGQQRRAAALLAARQVGMVDF